jgi:hypothetical protein
MKYRDKGRLHLPTSEDGEYIYSPPAWRVCNKCDGKGREWNPIIGTCSRCHGTGRIPIYYTPEQWQEAGGVLSDFTPVWVRFTTPDIGGCYWALWIFREVKEYKDSEIEFVIIAT